MMMEQTLDVSEVANAVASVVRDPPPPLPVGWFLKESKSNPGFYYYFNSETGTNTWKPPMQSGVLASTTTTTSTTSSTNNETADTKSQTEGYTAPQTRESGSAAVPDVDPKVSHQVDDGAEKAAKKRKTDAGPTEVRVLHILKKHKGSRRPSSWRQPVISQTLEEAREELQGLHEILQEEESPEELRATFEELARTESDCSSAKRGGDLGFFGRKKMQPAFEAASFALQVGELTKELVETSSGAHIILRIG